MAVVYRVLPTIFILAVIVATVLLMTHSGIEELVVPLVIVEGRSMLPLLTTGDIVIVVKVAPQDIKPGDVIVFRSLRGHLVIHRVLGVRIVGGEYYYITKGDNNLAPDYLEFNKGIGVPYARVVGAVVSFAGMPIKIPLVGLIALTLKDLLGVNP